MIRKSGNRFSEKIMLKQRNEIMSDSIYSDHDLTYFQNLDPGQGLAFHPFEKRAARGRYIGKIAGHAGLVQRRHRVAAAGDRDQLLRPGPVGRMPRRHHGAVVEWRHLEGTERAVPDQRRGVVDRGMYPRDRSRADVEDHAVEGDRIETIGMGWRMGRE